MLVRTITLTQTEKGYRIQADYKVTNTSATPTPWAWSAHPGYAAEEGDLLSLPDSIQALRIEWTRNDRLDKSSGTAAWPIAKLAAGGKPICASLPRLTPAWATSSLPVL